MRRSLRSTRWLAAGVAVGCAATAMLLVGGAPAAVYERSSTTAAHRCLVMTGSGDPAFVRNFNPYTATGLPSGAFVLGAIYEPLVISPEGGLPAVPWLARTWKWSNGNKTLTLNLAQGVKWADGQALTSADVVYSLKGGTAAQAKTMDRIGFTRPDSNITSITAKGPNTVVIALKT